MRGEATQRSRTGTRLKKERIDHKALRLRICPRHPAELQRIPAGGQPTGAFAMDQSGESPEAPVLLSPPPCMACASSAGVSRANSVGVALVVNALLSHRCARSRALRGLHPHAPRPWPQTPGRSSALPIVRIPIGLRISQVGSGAVGQQILQHRVFRSSFLSLRRGFRFVGERHNRPGRKPARRPW